MLGLIIVNCQWLIVNCQLIQNFKSLQIFILGLEALGFILVNHILLIISTGNQQSTIEFIFPYVHYLCSYA